MDLNKFGWELISLSVETIKYNNLYKIASHKEKLQNNIDIKYHLNLWVLNYNLDTYFICENMDSKWTLFKSVEIKNYTEIDKINILVSNKELDTLIIYIKNNLIFSKEYLRDYKINILGL